MSRQSGIWWRKDRKCWTTTIRGKQRSLGRGTRAEAQQELYRLLAEGPEDPEEPPEGVGVAEILDRYYGHAKEALEPRTLPLYGRRLKEFSAMWGHLAAGDVRPRHLTEWLAARAWATTTKRTAAAIVKRAFAWATRQGYLDRDPTLGFQKPPGARREAVITEADIRAILAAAPGAPFRDFLTAVWETGCRPGEAAKVTARDFDPEARTWTIAGKTSKKTGRKRVVYLTDEVVAICRRLAAEHPQGPIFRNSYGDPWSEGAPAEYLRHLRERLGLERRVVAAGLRHLFATDALDRGVPIATVAELLGHTSTAMVSKHYSHLSDRTDHLRDAVDRVRPRSDASGRSEADEGPPPSAPSSSPRRKPPGRKA